MDSLELVKIASHGTDIFPIIGDVDRALVYIPTDE